MTHSRKFYDTVKRFQDFAEAVRKDVKRTGPASVGRRLILLWQERRTVVF